MSERDGDVGKQTIGQWLKANWRLRTHNDEIIEFYKSRGVTADKSPNYPGAITFFVDAEINGALRTFRFRVDDITDKIPEWEEPNNAPK